MVQLSLTGGENTHLAILFLSFFFSRARTAQNFEEVSFLLPLSHSQLSFCFKSCPIWNHVHIFEINILHPSGCSNNGSKWHLDQRWVAQACVSHTHIVLWQIVCLPEQGCLLKYRNALKGSARRHMLFSVFWAVISIFASPTGPELPLPLTPLNRNQRGHPVG